MSATQDPPYEPFSVSVVPDRTHVTVVPAGELDMESVDQVDTAVHELWEAGFDQVVVDLRRVAFMDSRGLQLLMALRNEAKRRGIGLTLVPGPQAVQRLFGLTKTRELFDWREVAAHARPSSAVTPLQPPA